MKELLNHLNSTVLNMAGLRLLSATFELTAVFLMLHFNSIQKAVVINASLAFVGPVIFIFTMALGLMGIAADLSFSKLALIGIGVGLILVGVLK
ncbi:YqhV family protein [Bacillus sp. Marseille-Q3570]|uniref:YqhV family protein n=1 Tax=Bacillus sp. Marseille-Q3570 TaxID=2963522 RepID=UPI0021B796F5|nr:YqhV family protein [Bacillus sp. Marseille-Q3570]